MLVIFIMYADQKGHLRKLAVILRQITLFYQAFKEQLKKLLSFFGKASLKGVSTWQPTNEMKASLASS